MMMIIVTASTIMTIVPNSGTKEGRYTNWKNLDTKYTIYHDYFKFLKYGFGRATD